MLHSQIKNNQITFTTSRYYTTESGNHVPSCSTILDAYPKSPQYLAWLKENGSDSDEIMRQKGDQGSVVHELTERYDAGEEINLLGDNGQPLYTINEWGFFERYVNFSDRFEPQHELIEQTVISEQLGFAGTIDRVSIINGKRYLIDLKTSAGIYNSYWLQVAAYRELLRVETKIEVDAVAILWVNAKTRTEGKKGDIQGIGWQLAVREDTTKDLELFRHTQNLWLAEHGEEKPKQWSYQLTHKKK